MATIIFLILLFLGRQTTTKANQQNWEATISAKINGPTVDQVWPYFADFCNVYKIFPTDVSYCVHGSDGQPGQIRYSVGKSPSPSNANANANANATVVLWTREELLAIDATKKYVTFEIHENNRGLDKFIGTNQLLDNGNSGCILKRLIVAAPIAGVTYKEFVDSLNVNLGDIVALIENLF